MSRDLTSLDTIHLPTTGGGQTPLSSVASASVGTGPLVINRQGQFPAATISFDVAPGKALGHDGGFRPGDRTARGAFPA